MATIILTTGVPGCGKTYVRCARFLVDDFLINSRGVHISNFPLNKSVVSDYVSKKINSKKRFFGFKNDVSSSDISFRIELIPDEILQSWRNELSGPWDYFSGRDLKYCHIAIDEIHNFINSRSSSEYLKKWDDFLGEIRHRGCTFEGLTQDISQVDQILTGRASVRLELVPAEDLRDPFFKIPLADWYQLKASFLRDFHKTVFVLEKRKQDSRWKLNHTYRFIITPDYFQFYNSYNASLQEKSSNSSVDDDRAPLQEYERRSRFSLLLWFLRRNFFKIFIKLSIFIFVFWLCFFGGLNYFIKGFLDSTKRSYKSNSHSVKKTAPISHNSFSPGSKPSNLRSPVLNSNSVINPSNYTPKNLDEIKYFNEKQEINENGYKPALFFDGKCWLRNGIRIYEGYIFTDESSRFYKKTVRSFDLTDRFYSLEDGTLVYMF